MVPVPCTVKGISVPVHFLYKQGSVTMPVIRNHFLTPERENDPDPSTRCRADRIRIRNTSNKKVPVPYIQYCSTACVPTVYAHCWREWGTGTVHNSRRWVVLNVPVIIRFGADRQLYSAWSLSCICEWQYARVWFSGFRRIYVCTPWNSYTYHVNDHNRNR